MLNSDLSEETQRIILAHELGHAVLHSSTGLIRFDDFAVFTSCDTKEYEANIFASEVLLADQDVIEIIEEGRDFYAIARELRVPPEMLDLKIRILQNQGYSIVAPYIAMTRLPFEYNLRPIDSFAVLVIYLLVLRI